MSNIVQYTESSFPTIYCERLVVRPKTTTMRWSPITKHPSIILTGNSNGAKAVYVGEERGIIAHIGYIIGTDSKDWILELHEDGIIHVGVSKADQSMYTIAGVAVDKQLDVKKGDIIELSLTTESTLSVKHSSCNNTRLGCQVFDLVGFIGQTLYPWVSTHKDHTMSVELFENVQFVTTVDTDGKVRMTGSNTDIVDFSVDDIYSNNPTVAPPVAPGTDDRISSAGGNVTVLPNGQIFLDGGLRYKCTEITTATPNVQIEVDQMSVIISNSATTAVTLPEVQPQTCQRFIIVRNYPAQPGEVWNIPVLNLYPSGSDTIEGTSHIGIPEFTDIQVMSNGLSNWRIL